MNISIIINQTLWLFYLLPVQHYIQTRGLSKWPLLRILWTISLGFLYLRFAALLFHFDVNYQYIQIQNFIMRPFHLSLAYIACVYLLIKLLRMKNVMKFKKDINGLKNKYKFNNEELSDYITSHVEIYNRTKVYIFVTFFMIGFITGSTYLVIK